MDDDETRDAAHDGPRADERGEDPDVDPVEPLAEERELLDGDRGPVERLVRRVPQGDREGRRVPHGEGPHEPRVEVPRDGGVPMGERPRGAEEGEAEEREGERHREYGLRHPAIGSRGGRWARRPRERVSPAIKVPETRFPTRSRGPG